MPAVASCVIAVGAIVILVRFIKPGFRACRGRHVFRTQPRKWAWAAPATFPLPMPGKGCRRTPDAPQGRNPIDERKRHGRIPTFGEMADEICEVLSGSFRNDKHKAQWRMTLLKYAGPLRSKLVGRARD